MSSMNSGANAYPPFCEICAANCSDSDRISAADIAAGTTSGDVPGTDCCALLADDGSDCGVAETIAGVVVADAPKAGGPDALSTAFVLSFPTHKTNIPHP